ncbi:MAG TPA: DUF6046 domain-containing protein [Dissulfurispiraceae bacterium]|nr:DUF6046 domain-containing protein [Dissulfurispiraceae bacterium]
MATFQFTIPELLRAAGIRGYLPLASAAINRALRAESEPEYSAAMHEAAEQVFGESPWFEGLPMWMPLELSHGEAGNPLLLDSALTAVSNERRVILTHLQGLDGSVKEFIANGDYIIKVRGLLARKGFGWPEEEVVRLKQMLRFKAPLAVTHQQLNALDIFELVILDWSLPHSPHMNVAAYEFTAVSNEPIELKQNV